MSELKPCPLCGGNASIMREPDMDGFGTFYFVGCVSCHASSGRQYASNGNDCPQMYAEVRERWNRRPPQPVTPAGGEVYLMEPENVADESLPLIQLFGGVTIDGKTLYHRTIGAPWPFHPPVADAALVDWAVGRWRAEVQNRPLVNVHRRSLDDAWRQVIRHAGGDDIVICGPRHDELAALNQRGGGDHG